MKLTVNVEARQENGGAYNQDITIDDDDLREAILKSAHRNISKDWKVTPVMASIRVKS